MLTDFIFEQMSKKWQQGLVPVWVEGRNQTEIIYVPRNEKGIFKKQSHTIMLFNSNSVATKENYNNLTMETVTVWQKEVCIKEPIISYRDPFEGDPRFLAPMPHVYLWKGEITNNNFVGIETLNVGQMLNFTQNIIRKREGIILAEALNNKLII